MGTRRPLLVACTLLLVLLGLMLVRVNLLIRTAQADVIATFASKGTKVSVAFNEAHVSASDGIVMQFTLSGVPELSGACWRLRPFREVEGFK